MQIELKHILSGTCYYIRLGQAILRTSTLIGNEARGPTLGARCIYYLFSHIVIESLERVLVSCYFKTWNMTDLTHAKKEKNSNAKMARPVTWKWSSGHFGFQRWVVYPKLANQVIDIHRETIDKMNLTAALSEWSNFSFFQQRMQQPQATSVPKTEKFNGNWQATLFPPNTHSPDRYPSTTKHTNVTKLKS